MSYPFLLLPYVAQLVWGGTRLITQYAIQTEKRNAAEAWVLSCRPDGDNHIQNGDFQGKTLAEVLATFPQFGGTRCGEFERFPLLVKLIDARDDLSVQVHPDDAYCKKTGSGEGKTECWYILECEEDAALVLGFQKELTLQQLEEAVAEDALMEQVRRVPVRKGDFFFIEAGTLHAICKGVLLAEVQQNSDTTYRIYDYNRPGLDGKPRALHIRDALAVAKREPYIPTPPLAPQKQPGCTVRPLAECALFQTGMVAVERFYEGHAGAESFVSLLVLEGSGVLLHGENSYSLQKGQSWFLPANCGDYRVNGKLEILETKL